MKNVYYVLLGVVILMSCGNNPKTNQLESDLSAEKVTVVKENLDSSLVKGILELVESKEHLKYPDISLDKSFIALSFIVDPNNSKINFSDSIVKITYNVFRDNNASIAGYYKGIVDVEGYNVAIFDIGGFGDKYYDAESLKQIPLDKFTHYPMKIILTLKYFVCDGKLNYWNP